MGIRGDDRAQAIQIGAVLLFGVLIIAFVSYQATVVPDQNRAVEFDHSLEVQSDMVLLRNSLVESATTGQSRPAAVELGVRYQPRALAVNPGPPSGSLRTAPLGSLTVSNAVASGEAADYWDGSDRSYATESLVYRPGYNLYDSAPTTRYEHSVLANEFPNGNVIPKSGQTLVQGRTITLVALRGDLSSTTSDTVTVDPETVSGPMRTVTVTDDGTPVTLTLESELPESTWQELLDAQYDPGDTDAGAYVSSVSCSAATSSDPCGTLTLTLEPGVTYNLRVGAVGLGSASSPVATYAVAVEGDDTSIPEGGSQKLVVEVRDEYNNPISGVDVSVTTTPGQGSASALSPTTDTEGRATFQYDAPQDVNAAIPVQVGLGFDGTDGDSTPGSTALEEAQFTVTVTNADGSTGGGGGGSGGGSGGGTTVQGSTTDVDGDGTGSAVSFTYDNTGATARTITAFAIDVTSSEDVKTVVDQSGTEEPWTHTIGIDTDSDENVDGYWDGSYDLTSSQRTDLDQPATVGAGESATVYLYRFERQSGGDADVSGRTLEVTLYYDDGTQETVTVST